MACPPPPLRLRILCRIYKRGQQLKFLIQKRSHDQCYSLLSVVRINIEETVYVAYTLSQFITEQNQGRNLNLGAGAEAETTEERCLLACSACGIFCFLFSVFNFILKICMSAVSKVSGPLGTGVTGGCKLPTVGAGNRTQVLCKNTVCS